MFARTRLPALILTTLFTLAQVAVANAADPHSQVAQAEAPLQVIHLGVLPNDDMTSVLYAEKTGMFRKAGLDVLIDRSSSSGAAIATAVAAGSYDIGKSSITPIFDAHLRGIPFTIIGAAAIYDSRKPYVGFLVPVDSPIHSATQLTGTNGVSFINDLGQLSVYKAIDDAGGDWHVPKFVEMPMSASRAAVESNRVEAAEISYPPAQQAIESGKVRLLPTYDTFGKQFIFSVWFTTGDYATKHADVVRKFAHVVSESAKFTNAHPNDTVEMLSEFTKIPADVIRRMPRVTNGTSVYASGIQPLIDTEAKYGFISRSFPATEIIDPDVLSK
jgi:ABC-type nitrate/sulfonate/bicarbonate transport system substrate-binding protein